MLWPLTMWCSFCLNDLRLSWQLPRFWVSYEMPACPRLALPALLITLVSQLGISEVCSLLCSLEIKLLPHDESGSYVPNLTTSWCLLCISHWIACFFLLFRWSLSSMPNVGEGKAVLARICQNLVSEWWKKGCRICWDSVVGIMSLFYFSKLLLKKDSS